MDNQLKALLKDIASRMDFVAHTRIAEILEDSIDNRYLHITDEDRLWLIFPVCKDYLTREKWWKQFLNFASNVCPDKGHSVFHDDYFPTYGFMDWILSMPRFLWTVQGFLKLKEEDRFTKVEFTEEEKRNIVHNTGADSYIGPQDHDPNGRFFQPK